jgi:hypothetical protein
VDSLFALIFPLVPIVGLILIVRHGPVRSRWWRGENALGFAFFVGAVSFLAGFLGPIVLQPDANQGPLLGIFISGPLGFALGLVWGLVRAARRKRSGDLSQP